MNDFTNSPAGSAAGTTLGTETVREFRVEANAYGAEFGRSPGGQINVITKSGTNAFHGSAYEFHRNDALDARNYFDPVEKPDFRRNQFGFTLGGPVRRDRTFFFVGYEGLRESLGRTISTVVPNEAARSGVLPAPGGGTVVVPVEPQRAPLPRRVPAAERGGARRRPRRLPLPVHADDRPGLLPGPARPEPGRARPAVPPLHARPGRAVPAHRLPPVPADVRVAEPVRDRGVPAGVLGPDPRDLPARLLAHADRPGGRGQHVPAAPALRARAGVARGDRHRGRPAVRAAGLRRRVDPAGRLRLQRRLPPHPRAALAQGRRPGRALPVQRGQPDLQPRHPLLRQPRGLPARPLAPLHRPHPRGGPRARVAAHAARPLRAGRGAASPSG